MRSPQSPRSPSSRDARGERARRLPASARLSTAGALLLISLILAGCGGSGDDSGEDPDRFDADAAFELIETQVDYGPRPAGSEASEKLGQELRRMLPNAEVQPLAGGLLNLISVIPGEKPAIVVGAHYDTEATVPNHVGANDGAAGTAAVVELARTVEQHLPEDHREVRFVLFDGEEEPPNCPDAEFVRCALRGSRAYALEHRGEIGEMILLDYIANKGLRIPREGNSDPALWEQLREAASEVGKDEVFPDAGAAAILDDHIPFIGIGVPSIDLIDFRYAYADTAEDTPDKLSTDSLDAVGETTAELIVRLASEPAPGG
jgi:glutaminyl-peptide cyclotransferase